MSEVAKLYNFHFMMTAKLLDRGAKGTYTEKYGPKRIIQ